MQAVLDTNVTISALLWGGAPFKLLELATAGKLTLYTSPVLLAELSEVLKRNHLVQRLSSQHTSVDEIIHLYKNLCTVVTPIATPRIVPNDIDDDQVIACAIASGTQLIISGDKDLLILHPWKDIHILNATEAVKFISSTMI